MTRPENLPTHIASLTLKDWQKLFELTPQIRDTNVFGKLTGSQKLADGSVSFPYWSEGEVVSKFYNTAYMLGLVVAYDWAAWHEGIDMLNDNHEAIDEFEIEDLCKLLTIMIRCDKFCEGYLVNCFERGLVVRVLEAMEVKVATAPVCGIPR
jgi:hypothetical protein